MIVLMSAATRTAIRPMNGIDDANNAVVYLLPLQFERCIKKSIPFTTRTV